MMKPSYFVSERVRLRAMEPEDLEIMYAMENDPQTWDVTNFSVPYSKYVLSNTWKIRNVICLPTVSSA